MASSSAVSKQLLFNVTKQPALIRRHLIRPWTQLIQSNSAPHEDLITDNPVNSRILDLNNASNFRINLRMLFNSALPRIQMARTYVPNNAEEEFDDDDDDDEDDDDDDDDDEDIQDFSGSDLDVEYDEEYDSRPRSRRYKKK